MAAILTRCFVSQFSVDAFMSYFVETAIEGDHAAHMALISKSVAVYGVPGFEVIAYEDWSRQCAEEFARNLIKAISYDNIQIVSETDSLICFETQETIEARDGTVNRNRLEVFLARETDEQWRIVQETILPAAGQSFGGGA